MYRTDLHVHTSEVSPCANISAPDTVEQYKKAGYDSIVITNHYFAGFFERDPILSWEQQVERYLVGFELAREKGKEAKLHVVLGMELTFRENHNDYLIYGIDKEFLLRYPYLYELTLEQFKKLAEREGLVVYQSHPFRTRMTVMPVPLLDGIEVYNGGLIHDSRNPIAAFYAQLNHLKGISGSDCHFAENVATGGILTDEPVTASQQLVAVLKAGRYELIRSERVS